jgi:predicted P-loop ATPase
MTAKAMTDFPPSAHDSLYTRLWKTIGERVGYGIDCDTLTDKVIDIVNECAYKKGDLWLNEDDGMLYINKGGEVVTVEAPE